MSPTAVKMASLGYFALVNAGCFNWLYYRIEEIPALDR